MADYRYDDYSGIRMLSAELNNLQTGSGSQTGTAYDNTLAANRYPLANFVLSASGASWITANKLVHLFRAASMDGTTYTNGNITATGYSNDGYLGSFAMISAAQQYRIITNIEIPNAFFKLALVNDCGIVLTGTAMYVDMYPFGWNAT